MGIFDNIINNSAQSNGAADESWRSLREMTFEFAALPENLAQLQQLPEAELANPFQTAALAVLGYCIFAADQQAGTQALNFCYGPRGFSVLDQQFSTDRVRGKSYLPFSYLVGASPQTNYVPTPPIKVQVLANDVSFDQPDQARLLVPCGGADSPRPIVLYHDGGKWWIRESLLLTDIRPPVNGAIWG